METCQHCGNGYTTVYWLPDEIWAKITPANSWQPEAGLLCPTCADDRASERGIYLTWTAYTKDTLRIATALYDQD